MRCCICTSVPASLQCGIATFLHCSLSYASFHGHLISTLVRNVALQVALLSVRLLQRIETDRLADRKNRPKWEVEAEEHRRQSGSCRNKRGKGRGGGRKGKEGRGIGGDGGRTKEKGGGRGACLPWPGHVPSMGRLSLSLSSITLHP